MLFRKNAPGGLFFFVVLLSSIGLISPAQAGGVKDFWTATFNRVFRPPSSASTSPSAPRPPAGPASLRGGSCTLDELRRGLCKERLKQEEGGLDPAIDGLLGKKKIGKGFTGLGLETDENGNPVFTEVDQGTTTRKIPLSSTDCGLTGSDEKGTVFLGWGKGKASDAPGDAPDSGGAPKPDDDDPKNPNSGSNTPSNPNPSNPSSPSSPSNPSTPSTPTAGNDSPTTPPKDNPSSPGEGKNPLDKLPDLSIPIGPDLKITGDGGRGTWGNESPRGFYGVIVLKGHFTPNPDAVASDCGLDSDSERAWQRCQQKCANINPGPDGGGCVCHEEISILFGGARYSGRCAQTRCAEDNPNCCEEISRGTVDEQAMERIERRRCNQSMPTDDGRGPCGPAEDQQRHCFEHPEDPLCGGRPAPTGDPRAGGFFRWLFGF